MNEKEFYAHVCDLSARITALRAQPRTIENIRATRAVVIEGMRACLDATEMPELIRYDKLIDGVNLLGDLASTEVRILPDDALDDLPATGPLSSQQVNRFTLQLLRDLARIRTSKERPTKEQFQAARALIAKTACAGERLEGEGATKEKFLDGLAENYDELDRLEAMADLHSVISRRDNGSEV